MIDPRTPVIVGAAQANERELDSEPIDALTSVVKDALARTGSPTLLAGRVGSVRVLQGMWSYRDAGRLVAEECELGAVQTTLSPVGGNEVYDLVNVTAADIQSGRLDAAVVCSSEVLRTTRRLRERGERQVRRPEPETATPDHSYAPGEQQFDADQIAVGAILPVNYYAMIEVAMRHERGESVEAHRKRIADLWARASEVAVDNPYAASQHAVSGDDVATVSARNRIIAAPYTKLMTANIDVDQAAAVVMCSFETARAAGVAIDDMVFLSAGTGAVETWELTKRWALHESPGMRIAGQRILELSGHAIDEFDDIDLYSCFPSAVQRAQEYLEMDLDRPYTITGGLTFSGGPFNSYCMHALATACDRIRDGRSARTLLTGNGGYFTKHAFAVLSNEPPELGFRYQRQQAEVDAGRHREPPSVVPSQAVMETYTVTYDREGNAETAIMSALDADVCRHWSATSNADVVAALVDGDRVGATVHFDAVTDALPEVTAIE